MAVMTLAGYGDFWYGDFKAPFETFDAGIPDYPKGVMLYEPVTLKVLCAYCGKTYDDLATHALRKHGLNATAYKDEVGLPRKAALVSERVRSIRIAQALRKRSHLQLGVHAAIEKPCAVSDCATDAFARGLCQMHYVRERTAGRLGEKLKAGRSPGRASVGSYNKTGHCRAQVLAVAQGLASDGRLTGNQLAKRYGISARLVAMYFGGLDNLRREVGAHVPHKWTPRELVLALRSLAAELGYAPRMSDLRRHGLPDRKTFEKHLNAKGRDEICRAAGLDPTLPAHLAVRDPAERDLAYLTAYAASGSSHRAAQNIGIAHPTGLAILHRWGYPFEQYDRSPERMVWAAEMAHRLRGDGDSAAA